MSDSNLPAGVAGFDDLPGSALVSVKAVSAIAGLGVSTLWRKTREGAFIQPVRVARGATRWRVADLRQWLAQHQPGPSLRGVEVQGSPKPTRAKKATGRATHASAHEVKPSKGVKS